MKLLKFTFYFFLITKVWSIDNSTTIAEVIEHENCSTNLAFTKVMKNLQEVAIYCAKNTEMVSYAPWCNDDIANHSFYDQITKCRFLVADGCGLSSKTCDEITQLCQNLKSSVFHNPDEWKNYCNSAKIFAAFDVCLATPLLAYSFIDLRSGNNAECKELYKDLCWSTCYALRITCQIMGHYTRYTSVVQWAGTPYAEAEHLHINCLRNAMLFCGISSICYFLAYLVPPSKFNQQSLLRFCSALFLLGAAATEIFNVDPFG